MTETPPCLSATEFLARRRSFPRPSLKDPAPQGQALDIILETGLRVSDHGRLEPWRLLIIDREAQARLAPKVGEAAQRLGREEGRVANDIKAWDSPLIVAVVYSPVEHPKFPQWEQHLSAGSVCLSILNAALAHGWGAVWLTGPAAWDRQFMDESLGLAAHEQIAGFIHMGSCSDITPERPRPNLAAKIQVL